ncbi:MAG: ABC transporter permease [Planctomycetes bacterium]|nr:ABC transporter permease [Planctomycetota bacterium]
MRRLLCSSLLFHWRGNLAVLLGVAVGSAVLTGALLVGDCLRGSLKALALDQLGWVDEALVASRFFRAALADDLPAERAAPAILLQGSATREGEARVPEGEAPAEPSGAKSQSSKNHGSAGASPSRVAPARTIGKVTILGVDQRFWPASSVPPPSWDEAKADVVLNATLAAALGARVGDSIKLNVQKPDGIPRESLLGKRKAEDVLEALTVTVRAIRPDDGMARFSLKPSPEPVRNAFVPLGFLQEKLEQPGRANAILAGGAGDTLQTALAKKLTLEDWGLRLRTPEDRARAFVRYLDPRPRDGRIGKFKWPGRVPEELAKQANKDGLPVQAVIDYYRKNRPYLSLESRQMFLEPAIARAVASVAEPASMIGIGSWFFDKFVFFAPTLVYLADGISDGKNDVSYAVVGAIDDWGPPPLGPLPTATDLLSEDEIILITWPGSPLHTSRGERIKIDYYAPNDHGQLDKKSALFKVKEVLPLAGMLDDPDLTPEFPGITDKLDMKNWEKPPFPFDKNRIQPSDDEYWKRHRTTPRAYVTLSAGQKLWGSRFGQLTSIRIAPVSEAAKFEAALLKSLDPAQGGFTFRDVKSQALRASAGSTDFSEYFLYFSAFLIIAAVMLVGLLFRLNLDRRAHEIGLLLALGWRQRQVRRLLLVEGLVLAVVGAGVGLLAAGAYARALLDFLAQEWPGGSRLSFLDYHPQPTSFLIGFTAAVAVSLFTIFWSVRALSRLAPKSLLAGETVVAKVSTGQARWSVWIAMAFAAGAVICLGVAFVATGHEAQTFSFFGGGSCLLIALLAAAWARMRRGKHVAVVGGANALARLGVRNAARHPVRSLLTIGLLASAMFLVVSVQSFHREVGSEFLKDNGGSGGFDLIVESDLPIFQDLNRAEGRRDLYAAARVPPALAEAKSFSFRVRPGDDASCLNLYQPLRPRLLGVPADLVARGGFHFTATLNPTDEEQKNPWLLLHRSSEDGAIPVVADANAAKYILHVGLGDTLEVPDERGQMQKLRIVGLLGESIFQGELLMSDGNFKKMYPRQEGFNLLLVQAGENRVDETRAALEAMPGLPGLSVTDTIDRVKGFLQVENTYLLTFQVLGGFGLLLGALGLAVVLLRSVWERRGELALLRALGFRRRTLGWFVLAENGYLLILGLAVGTLSAVVAVSPFLLGSGSRILWLQLICLLAIALVVGLGAAAIAVAATLRAPLLSALRRE